MAGNKIFYVTRTETEGQPAGAATLHRGDKPQLLKIVGVDHAGNPDPATPEDNQIYATEEENQEILFTSDTVQAGDLNPVTSDAVWDYIQDQLELSDYEAITISTNSATPTEMQYDGLLTCDIGSVNSSLSYLYINGVQIARELNPTGGGNISSSTVAVKKGDLVYVANSFAGTNAHIRYYKLRDYSNRS